MIEKPVITGFTIESAVLDQPPVPMSGKDRYLVVDLIKIVISRFGEELRWGAAEVWLYGQVANELFQDCLVWRSIPHWHQPQSVEDSPSLPDWVAAFVKERLQRTTQ